jgi:hypothetical protein
MTIKELRNKVAARTVQLHDEGLDLDAICEQLNREFTRKEMERVVWPWIKELRLALIRGAIRRAEKAGKVVVKRRPGPDCKYRKKIVPIEKALAEQPPAPGTSNN